MLKQLREKDGFSPVEVLIAMGILAIGIVSVVKLFPSGLAFSRMAQEKSIAAELAESNISRMRMTGASNLLGVAQAGTLYGTSATASSYDLGVGGRKSNGLDIVNGYAASVHRVGASDDQALVRVTFTVDMPDGRRENFVTYVTDY